MANGKAREYSDDHGKSHCVYNGRATTRGRVYEHGESRPTETNNNKLVMVGTRYTSHGSHCVRRTGEKHVDTGGTGLNSHGEYRASDRTY